MGFVKQEKAWGFLPPEAGSCMRRIKRVAVAVTGPLVVYGGVSLLASSQPPTTPAYTLHLTPQRPKSSEHCEGWLREACGTKPLLPQL